MQAYSRQHDCCKLTMVSYTCFVLSFDGSNNRVVIVRVCFMLLPLIRLWRWDAISCRESHPSSSPAVCRHFHKQYWRIFLWIIGIACTHRHWRDRRVRGGSVLDCSWEPLNGRRDQSCWSFVRIGIRPRASTCSMIFVTSLVLMAMILAVTLVIVVRIWDDMIVRGCK